MYLSVVLNICFIVDSSPETQTSLQSVVQFYMDAAESYSKVPSTLLAYTVKLVEILTRILFWHY